MSETDEVAVSHDKSLTAEILRQAIAQHPLLQPLPDGKRFLLGF